MPTREITTNKYKMRFLSNSAKNTTIIFYDN